MDPIEQEIRTEVARRAKLRAEAKLPPIDIEAEVAFEMAQARRRQYEAEEAKHEAEWQRIWAEVYAEQRARRGDPGWPRGSGGHTMIYRIARQRFREFLAQQGVEHVPHVVRNGVVYGSSAEQS